MVAKILFICIVLPAGLAQLLRKCCGINLARLVVVVRWGNGELCVQGAKLIKNVIKWSYWLGVVCSVIAVASRAMGLFGFRFSAFPAFGTSADYQRFVDRAFFFFIICIATETYIRSQKASRKNQPEDPVRG